jgi:hypothetical protein
MAPHKDLLELLRGLEIELHQLETRCDPERLDALLHPEFEEFGRSGRRYSRSDVLLEFAGASAFPTIVASEFRLRSLASDVALLSYASAHSDEAGGLHRYTLRSSLWVREAHGWRLIFHQGTPAGDEMVAT